MSPPPSHYSDHLTAVARRWLAEDGHVYDVTLRWALRPSLLPSLGLAPLPHSDRVRFVADYCERRLVPCESGLPGRYVALREVH